MKLSELFMVLLLSVLCPRESDGFDLSSVVEWVSEKVGFSACRYIDCCNKQWNTTDFQDLYTHLQKAVYGQNIALDVVVPALQGHLLPDRPKNKALVFSFHGRPGIGKNYVANIIQKTLFNKHRKTKYTHFFSGRKDFLLASEVENYRIHLMALIARSVKRCEYSFFIFDEVNKMPHGVLDAIVPYIGYHEDVNGIDYRKTIFILISNTGGDIIAQRYLTFWKSGKTRNSLRMSDFENLVMLGAFNDEGGGLYRSDAIEGGLIDHYVPFLPLEELHVRQCIMDQFKMRHMEALASEYTDEIVNDLTFGPDDSPIFSNSGCKRISPKVAAVAERAFFIQRDRNEL